jgi:hypothetical protein
VSCDGNHPQQVWKLYTGHVASHELKGIVFSNTTQGDLSGNCQSEQHSPSERPLPTVANDNAKKQRRDDQSFPSAASGMTSQVLAVLCYGRVLRVHLVSDVFTSFSCADTFTRMHVFGHSSQVVEVIVYSIASAQLFSRCRKEVMDPLGTFNRDVMLVCFNNPRSTLSNIFAVSSPRLCFNGKMQIS